MIGYARVSTAEQDLTAQRGGLTLGVGSDVIYVDHGFTGTHRERPGLRQALAACRAGDALVVTKLDQLARSLPDARDIADEPTTEGVALNLGGSVYDPTNPIGKLLFNVLGMVAEFETDLIRARTREGMAVAKAKGRLRGQEAQAVSIPGGPPGQAPPRGKPHHHRDRRALQRRPIHRLPSHRPRSPRSNLDTHLGR